MAGIGYSFAPKALIETSQFSRRFKGNNAFVCDDQQDRDANGADQLAIVGVWRGQNIKGACPGLPPRIGNEFDEFGRAMRVSKPHLSQRLVPIEAEKSAMLLDDVALVNLALALEA